MVDENTVVTPKATPSPSPSRRSAAEPTVFKGPQGEEIGVTLGTPDKFEEADDPSGRKRLASAITGWDDKLTLDGEAFPFTAENALALVNRYDWLRAGLAENVK